MRLKTTIAILLLAFSSAARAQPQPKSEVADKTLAMADIKNSDTQLTDLTQKKLLYTTYFYTAGEAIVHGYENDTGVRIVSLERNETIWQGTVNNGQTASVPTGQGVFAFLSDKKASILVGTPTSCTAVGYYLRDQDGTFKSSRFLTQLPSSVARPGSRVLVWAWNDTEVQFTNHTNNMALGNIKMKAGDYYALPWDLNSIASNVLEIQARGPDISVQVYYDEGFHVPSASGRVAGKIFRTYVGTITEGSNDLNLINYGRDTNVHVQDMESKEVIFDGKLQGNSLHSIRLSGKYVEITSNDEISVLVAPYNFQGYAEHHFAGGQEGTGIETNFITTTSDQLWLFSYFDNNPIKVMNMKGEVLWEGNLNAGNAQGYFPGAGVYRVAASQGISVMGGSAACGAEYSPAGGLFRIDEELFKVAKLIVETRKQDAAKQGKVLTTDELNAPLTASELERASDFVEENSGRPMSAPAVQSRMKSMQVY